MWDWTENQIDLYLIRHGMTAANEEHRYLGKTEESLSERGIRQLEQLAGSGKLPKPELVLCSPMQRCIESAAILFPAVPVIEIQEWKEMDFGNFENKNYEELNGNPAYQAWIDSGGKIAFPGGESREDFIARTATGMENVLEFLTDRLNRQRCPECGTAGQCCVAAVVHGGIIMALLSRYAGGDYFDYQVENAKGYHCRLWIREDKLKIELKETL